jgi:hypothetical protein
MDTERSTDEFRVVHPTSFRKSIKTYEDVKEVLDALGKDAERGANRRFKSVAVDTFDSLGGGAHSIIAEYIMRETDKDSIGAFGHEGQGWHRLNELVNRIVLRFEQLGLGWFVTVHMKEKTVGNEVRPVRDLFAGADRVLINRCKFIALLFKKIASIRERETITIEGQSVETDGRLIQQNTHWCGFTSADKNLSRLLKTRYPISGEFQWGIKSGYEDFDSEYKQAVERAKEVESVTTEGATENAD